MNETELLPCPFCGAQAFGPYIAHVTIPAAHPLNHYQVGCSDQSHCGAVVTGVRLKTEADAVKHWNKANQAGTIPRATIAAARALGIQEAGNDNDAGVG